MPARSTSATYGWITRTLHWTLAGSILAMVWLGWFMVGLGYYDPWYNRTLGWHDAIGMLVLGLAITMVIWTRFDRRPAHPSGMSPLERVAARCAHSILYLLMLAIPLSGYLTSTANGDGVDVFGLFTVPALSPVGDATRDGAIVVHYWLAYAVPAVVGLHMAAALKHQFWNRDGTLSRMLFGRTDASAEQE